MIWHVLILAGQRTTTDAVAVAAKVPVKALAPVGGQAMLRRVYDALMKVDQIARIAVIGDLKLLRQHQDTAELDVIWIQNEPSLPMSVLAGVDALGLEQPLLVTTADHALLTTNWVTGFLNASAASSAHCTLAVTNFNAVKDSTLTKNRTSYRLSDGSYGGCNLFALMAPSALGAINFWTDLHQSRKKPWRVISKLGLRAVLRFITGQLSLADAATALSQRSNCRIKPILITDVLAATDVDKLDDWYLVQRLVKNAGTDS